MSSLKLNPDGDLDFTNNKLSLTSGIDAIRQHIQERFRTFFGEWMLDTTIGVPWFQQILVKAPLFPVVQQILKIVIVSTPGVLELIDFIFDFDPETREASLDFAARTTDGDLDFSVLVEI